MPTTFYSGAEFQWLHNWNLANIDGVLVVLALLQVPLAADYQDQLESGGCLLAYPAQALNSNAGFANKYCVLAAGEKESGGYVAFDEFWEEMDRAGKSVALAKRFNDHRINSTQPNMIKHSLFYQRHGPRLVNVKFLPTLHFRQSAWNQVAKEFYWPRKVVNKLLAQRWPGKRKRSKLNWFPERVLGMLTYACEILTNLMLDPSLSVSTAPGFESPLGFFGRGWGAGMKRGLDGSYTPRVFKNFEDARAHMHALSPRLRSCKHDFFKWNTSRPPDMPGNPYKFYQGGGWTSWPDFLGYVSSISSLMADRELTNPVIHYRIHPHAV
jgi:hypothetical protein